MIGTFGIGPRVKCAFFGVWDGTFDRKRRQVQTRRKQHGERVVERGGERVEAKRMCVNRVPCNCFEDFSPMAECESDGDSLGLFVVCTCGDCCACCACYPVEIVSGFGEIVLSGSDCEFGESQTFFFSLSLSKKRDAPSVEGPEEMNIGGTPKKTPPASRKKIRGIEYGGEHRWTTRGRTVIEKMKHHLDRRENLSVAILAQD